MYCVVLESGRAACSLLIHSIYIWLYVHLYMYVCVYIHMYICLRMHVLYKHIYINIYLFIHSFIHSFIWLGVDFLLIFLFLKYYAFERKAIWCAKTVRKLDYDLNSSTDWWSSASSAIQRISRGFLVIPIGWPNMLLRVFPLEWICIEICFNQRFPSNIYI